MTLRVTQGIIYANALHNIRAVTSRNLATSNQVATGKRVSRPSDDPAAILQILPLRAEIRDLTQTQDLLESSRLRVDNAAAMLENASGTMASLRELTVLAANGTSTETARREMVPRIDDMLQQLLSSANATWNGSFLFGGARTDQAPFEIVTAGGGSRAVYKGDVSVTSIQVTAGITAEVNITGDRVFAFHERQPTTFEGSTGAQPSGAADSGIGFGRLQVGFAGLSIPSGTTGIAAGDNSTTALGAITYAFAAGSPPTLSLDGGPPQAITGGVQSFTVGTGTDTISLNVTTPVTPATGTITSLASLTTDGGKTTLLVDDFSGATPYQVRNSYDGTVLNVDVTALARTGSERVKFNGTFDPFTTLLAIKDLLLNAEGDSASTVSEHLAAMLPEVDFGHDAVLSALQELGNRSQNLSLFGSRLGELELARRGSLTEIEDVDLGEALIRLHQEQLSYQASLQVGATAVQTTLLNFLG